MTSSIATLKMGPTITGQPSDYTGVVGGTATMKVTANGSGLKYQWYVSKDSGKSWNSLGSDFARASVSFTATEARNVQEDVLVLTVGAGTIKFLLFGKINSGQKAPECCFVKRMLTVG